WVTKYNEQSGSEGSKVKDYGQLQFADNDRKSWVSDDRECANSLHIGPIILT
ncbi:unnamed protein product, partial [Didymodactylos carnosus]